MPESSSKTYVISPAETIDRAPRPKPQVPDHELICLIGRGAYGEVWLARNVVGTHRAVKVVHRGSFDDDSPYEREYRGIQKFEPISRSSEGFVDILQIGRNDAQGLFYYVMELADDATPLVGTRSTASPSFPQARDEVELVPTDKEESLLTSAAPWESYSPKTLHSEIRQQGRLPFEQCLEFAMSLNLALGHLHRQGLIHRDIKPSNIVFVGGVPKLADIGLVTEVEHARTFVGTEGFIPPEGPNSPRADIYSLGKVLYEMSMGKDRTEFPEPFTALGQGPASAELEELNAIILKACATDPRDRYQSAEEMHVDLALLQDGKSVKSKRMLERRLGFARKAGALVGVIALIATAAFAYQQFQTREARRLAGENRELASREGAQRERAEGLLNTLQMKEAEHFFENDDANKGVAYLAHLFRQNPTNQIVGSRLMSALTDRSFAVPLRTYPFSNSLWGAQFHPKGQQFVTWGRSGTIFGAQLWDVATGQALSQPMLHSSTVLRALFSPDGRLLATMTVQGDIRIWDVTTGKSRSHIRPQSKPNWRFDGPMVNECIAFSPNGEMLLTAGENQARVWNISKGELVFPPLEHGAEISDVDFSADGRRIATSGGKFTKLWNSISGAFERKLAIGDGGWDRAEFSPDGRRIVAVGGFSARAWDTDTGERVGPLGGGGGNFVSARFSPDGGRIVGANVNRTALIWDAETGRDSRSLTHGAELLDAQFDPTGERLLTWERRRARVWDSRSGRPLTEWMLHSADICSAEFSPDGQSVLTLEPERAILWDIRFGRAVNMALRHRTLVPLARFSRDGARVVTVSGGDVYGWAVDHGPFEAAIWDSRTGELVAPRITHSNQVQYAEFSPDGGSIVTACFNGEARVWDAQTGAAISEVMQHSNRILSARFSPDGRKLVTASWDRTARIWDANTGRPLTSPLQRFGRVDSAEFSPDGLSVLTIAPSGGARIFDAATGAQGTNSYGKEVSTACFSPDGRLLATGSSDGSGQIWNLKTKREIGEPFRHKAPISSVRFSPDGRCVVTASEDQTARVWDVLSGRPIAEPLVHKGVVLHAEFSPDSRRVVTAATDFTARVWDVATGRPLTEPFRESYLVAHAEFSPDGTRVLLASAAYLARICELPPAGATLPKWLPGLAEAMAGERWTDQGELVPPEQYLALRAELLKTVGTDEQSRWLEWLLADRSARTVSYGSAMSVSKYVARMPEGSGASASAYHREALHILPNDSVATVGLAYLALEGSSPNLRGAKFLAKRAMMLIPLERGAWGTLADVFEKTGSKDDLRRVMKYLLVRTNGLVYGALRREMFTNIAGARLSDLTNHSRFPNSADVVGLEYEFKTLSNQGEEFGVRLSGYLVPPITGEYRFYLCSNEEGALFLSTDESPEHKRQIAHEPKKNSSRLWTVLTDRPNKENISAPIWLEADRRYYVEALMKEDQGYDNLAVAWQMPGEPPPENLSPPIPGTYLAVPPSWVESTVEAKLTQQTFP